MKAWAICHYMSTLKLDFKKYLEANKTSLRELKPLIGMSPSAISQYLNNPDRDIKNANAEKIKSLIYSDRAA